MSTVRIDWDKANEEFWQRLRKEAPNSSRLLDLIAGYYKALWLRFKTVPPGYEETVNISVSKEGQLVANLSGWVLLGAIALATRHGTLDEVKKQFQEEQARHEEELKRLRAEIQGIKDRLDKYEIR